MVFQLEQLCSSCSLPALFMLKLDAFEFAFVRRSFKGEGNGGEGLVNGGGIVILYFLIHWPSDMDETPVFPYAIVSRMVTAFLAFSASITGKTPGKNFFHWVF